MTSFNANQYPDVYTALGIDLAKLGVVMLDVDTFPVTELITEGEADLYESPHESRFWIAGAVVERTAHVTLLYGLLEQGLVWKPLIDIVLTGWTPPLIEIDKVGFFPSPYPEEDYVCIVAHVKVTPELLEGNHRLELLPHINTFPSYNPHITLAYVKTEAKDRWLKQLGTSLNGKKLTVNKVNYGENHG